MIDHLRKIGRRGRMADGGLLNAGGRPGEQELLKRWHHGCATSPACFPSARRPTAATPFLLSRDHRGGPGTGRRTLPPPPRSPPPLRGRLSKKAHPSPRTFERTLTAPAASSPAMNSFPNFPMAYLTAFARSAAPGRPPFAAILKAWRSTAGGDASTSSKYATRWSTTARGSRG